MILKTFKSHADKSGRLTLEGYANVSTVVDRVNDVIEPGEWRLENFKANPVVLFNHDISLPLGTAEDVKVDEKGLWVKCVIDPEDDHPVIKSVYKKIKSGTIKAFSVRVTAQDSEVRNGVNYLKSVDLEEVTVTPLPVNQASTFNLVKSVGSEIDSLTSQVKVLTQSVKSLTEMVSTMKSSALTNQSSTDDQSIDDLFADISSKINDLEI